MIAHIGVGSNIDPAVNVPAALRRLGEACRPVAVSPFFVTEPIDRPDQDAYWNGAVAVEVADDADPVRFQLDTLRGIEAELGRERTRDAYAARTIDLDVVLWGEARIDRDGLVIPDPDILTRPFLARALLELAPGIIVPGHDRPLQDLAPSGTWELERAPLDPAAFTVSG